MIYKIRQIRLCNWERSDVFSMKVFSFQYEWYFTKGCNVTVKNNIAFFFLRSKFSFKIRIYECKHSNFTFWISKHFSVFLTMEKNVQRSSVYLQLLPKNFLMHIEYQVTFPDHDFIVGSKHILIPSVISDMKVVNSKDLNCKLFRPYIHYNK